VEEVEAFISETLKAYTAMTLGVEKPPDWGWTSQWRIYYSPRERKIYIHELLKEAWKLDPELTKRFLKYALAHEFAHYVQHVRGVSVLEVVKVPIIEFPMLSEYLARKKATMLSGITRVEADALETEVLELLARHGYLIP